MSDKRYFTITQTEEFRVPAESAQQAMDTFLACESNYEFYEGTTSRTLTDDDDNQYEYEED